MFVLVTYDIRTLDLAGRRRLRRVAKACLSYGQRVQFRVFECDVTPALWVTLKERLLQAFNPKEDSLRFYFLGSPESRNVEHHGIKAAVDFKAPLVL